MQKLTLIAVLLSITFSASVAADNPAEWQLKKARIMTPWAEQVNPEAVLPEYPRPQLVRDNWLNLNGIWDFTRTPDRVYNADQTFTNKILVPFPMESAISGLMWRDLDNQYINKNYLYRRTFTIPESMKGKKILLHFGGVGWLSEVYVNGTKVGSHRGEYDPFYFDISSALTGSGAQELSVFVQDFQNHGGAPSGKQKTNEKVIWYTPSTGIWQTVWLEAVNDVHIEKLVITPDIDRKEININTHLSACTDDYSVALEVYEKGKFITSAVGLPAGINKALKLPEMKLWSPDDPFLYDLKVRLYKDGKEVDAVDSYFGMRKISKGTFAGKPCILLNNSYIFQHGVLDQGYWPDGIYTAPTDEALKYDLEIAKKFGMNMVRKHIKVEPARWFYHCDKLGLLVWQDMPNAEGSPRYEGLNDKQKNFHREMERMVESYYNHPSVVMWVVYNEGWGQPGDKAVVRRGVDIVREMDTTRLVSVASGWHDQEYGDIKDTHWYPDPNLYPNPENKRVAVCGEYGGITLRIDGHQWLGGSNMTYTQVNTSKAFHDLFIRHTERINGLGTEGISGAVYTQITDLEDEENGLMTYDRKVIKVDEEQMQSIAAKIRRNYTHSSIEILPTSQDKTKKASWQYLMTDTPLKNTKWKNSNFNDNGWSTGKAPFGNEVRLKYGHDDQPRIENWKNNYIYMRRTVEFSELLTEENLQHLRAKIFHDEDCELYINGTLVGSWTGHVSQYEFKELDVKKLRKAIKIGQPNVIAVYCKQTTGGQFIDIGLCLYDVERKDFMK